MGLFKKIFTRNKEIPSVDGLIVRLGSDKISIGDKYNQFIIMDNLELLLDNWDNYSAKGKNHLVSTLKERNIYQKIVLALKGKGELSPMTASYFFIVMGEDICGKDLLDIINQGQFIAARISEIIISYSHAYGEKLLNRVNDYPANTGVMILVSLANMKLDGIGLKIAAVLSKYKGSNLRDLIDVLGDLRDNSVIDYLLPLLDDDDYPVVVAVINALGNIGDSSVVAQLKSYDAKNQWHVQEAIRYALSRLEGDADDQ